MINQKQLPKNVKLVIAIATYLDSELEVGEKRRMTKLSKEIILDDGSNPHKDTVTNKLTEAKVLMDVLKNFKFYFEKGELIEIEKVQELNTNEEILKSLLEILREIKKLQRR